MLYTMDNVINNVQIRFHPKHIGSTSKRTEKFFQSATGARRVFLKFGENGFPLQSRGVYQSIRKRGKTSLYHIISSYHHAIHIELASTPPHYMAQLLTAVLGTRK